MSNDMKIEEVITFIKATREEAITLAYEIGGGEVHELRIMRGFTPATEPVGYLVLPHPVQPAPLAPAKQLMTDTQAQEIIDSVSTFSGSYELAIVRATEAALGHSASGECGGVQVKPLTDEQVYWIAQSHGIGVHTCDVLGFYADLISTTPPVQVPLTEAQIQACLPGAVRLPQGWLAFARAIEAAHGIVAPAPSSDDASGKIKTGFCKLKAQPGGCPMHNTECGWPMCDQQPEGE